MATAEMAPPRPAPSEFRVAIICALPEERNAVVALLKYRKNWHTRGFRSIGDLGEYVLGSLGGHNVVLLMMTTMGSVETARVSAGCRLTFKNLKLALVVGICGGVPYTKKITGKEMLLGDVVISKQAFQWDAGHQYDTGLKFNTTIKDSLGPTAKSVSAFLQKFELDEFTEDLKEGLNKHLSELQQGDKGLKYKYPGPQFDKLFKPIRSHKHQPGSGCSKCSQPDKICDEALAAFCDSLDCEGINDAAPANDERRKDNNSADSYLEVRERLQLQNSAPTNMRKDSFSPEIHWGVFGSGNAVVKSAKTRYDLWKNSQTFTKNDGGLVGIEMEGAGAWASFDCKCVIIKAVTDYADGHKNKVFRNYAAGAGAACAKAVLEMWEDNEVEKAPSKPQCHFVVPFRRNVNFVGRETMLDQLVQSVPPDSNDENCQETVIHGLGGVGKTQLALEVAYLVRKECSVFWVSAVNKITFENGYRDIGKALELPGLNDNKLDLKSLVKAALEQSLNSWLLIIDNVDNIDMMFGDDTSLRECLPSSRQGSILLTTRVNKLAVRLDIPTCSVFEVAEMSETEATKMLQKSLSDKQMRDMESTKSLLAFLAYLPLAIKQASAYMKEHGIYTAQYLWYCRQSDKNVIKLLSQKFEDNSRYPGATNPITTTWLISSQHIAAHFPLAARYLKLMCFLAEKDILTTLLPNDADEIKKNKAIGVLKGYAFIVERDQEDSFDMHRLVRLAMRNWLANGSTYPYTETVQQLARVYPWPKHENRLIWLRYMPHAEAILSDEIECTDRHAHGKLLSATATSHETLGKYEEAETMNWKALELCEKVLGPEHPNTLTSMNNLASVLNSQGKYEEAKTMHQKALELCEKVLGPEHPNTLTSMNNLASVLERQGKYQEAETMHQKASELREKVLGPEHPDTLISMNNLASVLNSQEKYEKAETMHWKALELREKVLGPEHPNTLTSMNNLASVLERQEKYQEAETMHWKALKLREKVLGPEHPDTLISMNNLAWVLKSQGKYEKAETMHWKALELREKVLGPEHPNTLTSMMHLAWVLNSQGEYEEAETMHRKALELWEKVLGPEHPNTLTSMNNLALVLEKQGKYQEAETMHRKVSELREKVLGPEHSNILTSMNNWLKTEMLTMDQTEFRGCKRKRDSCEDLQYNR